METVDIPENIIYDVEKCGNLKVVTSDFYYRALSNGTCPEPSPIITEKSIFLFKKLYKTYLINT